MTAAHGHTRPHLPVWAALVGTALIGALTAVQSRANGQLGVELEDGFVAALFSFGSGFVLVGILALVFPSGRQGARVLVRGLRSRAIPWWMLAGGAAGAFTVAVQGFTVGVIGVSLFTVGYVGGQTLAGLLVDRVGFGPSGRIRPTVPRVAGGALALAAVVISFVGGGAGAAPLFMLVLPVAAGVGVAWQQAVNGRLRAAVGTPLTATVVNFAGGTLLLAIAAAVHVAANGLPEPFPPHPWLYIGGVAGVIYIFLSASLVAHTGVLLLVLGTIVGQLGMAFLLDVLWPAPSSPGLAVELIVVLVALSSVVVASLPWRRTRA